MREFKRPHMSVEISGEGWENDVRERNDRNSHLEIQFLWDSCHPLHLTCTDTCKSHYIQGACDLGKDNSIAAVYFKCNKGAHAEPGEDDWADMLKGQLSEGLGLPHRKGSLI